MRSQIVYAGNDLFVIPQIFLQNMQLGTAHRPFPTVIIQYIFIFGGVSFVLRHPRLVYILFCGGVNVQCADDSGHFDLVIDINCFGGEVGDHPVSEQNAVVIVQNT